MENKQQKGFFCGHYIHTYIYTHALEVYKEYSQISKLELFLKIVNCIEPLLITQKKLHRKYCTGF